MRLTVEEATAWAQDFYARQGKKLVWKELAADSGVRYVTLNVQRRKDAIDLQLIVGAARAYGENPLVEIAHVPRFAQVAPPGKIPPGIEIASTLHPAYIFSELARRLSGENDQVQVDGPWDDFPYRFGAWFSYHGSERSRQTIIDNMDVKSSTLNAWMVGRGTLHIDWLIEAAQLLGIDPIYGLVLAGHITDVEAGYPTSLRNAVLNDLSNDDLVDVSTGHMRYAKRSLADAWLIERARDTLK